MNIFGTVATIWISVGTCVAAGLYLTHNANCLWAFLIPALIKVSSGNGEKKEDE